MTVILDLPPLLEATVQANAQAKGVSIERYLLTLVEREVVVPAPPPGSEDWTLQDALDYAGPLPENLGRDGTRQRGDPDEVLEQPKLIRLTRARTVRRCGIKLKHSSLPSSIRV